MAKKKELPPIPKITPQSAPNSSPSPPSSARQKRIQPVYATAAEVDSDSDLEDVKPTTINKNPIVPMVFYKFLKSKKSTQISRFHPFSTKFPKKAPKNKIQTTITNQQTQIHSL